MKKNAAAAAIKPDNRLNELYESLVKNYRDEQLETEYWKKSQANHAQRLADLRTERLKALDNIRMEKGEIGPLFNPPASDPEKTP